MRSAFFEALVEEAERDERVHLVIADVGFGVVEPFVQRFPDRFLNVGVAEQNLIGVSAGLALSGARVFAYSIANFPTLRCLEQIRNDLCYESLPVTIVSAGTGVAYGQLGVTHHATEDIGVMRGMPNLTLLSPGDPVEARWATGAALNLDGPAYLRLGRAGEPVVHGADAPAFEVGRMVPVAAGDDLTLIATGSVLAEAMGARDLLAERGISARVLSAHTLSAIDHEAIEAAVAETSAILTVEEHSIVGGLGSAVAEVLAELPNPVRLKRIGLPKAFVPEVGSQQFLRRRYGLDAPGIAETTAALS